MGSVSQREKRYGTIFLLVAATAFWVPRITADESERHSTLYSKQVAQLMAEQQGTGIVVFPAEYSGGRPVAMKNPAGFHLHMTDADDPGEELLFPAGQVFNPPTGRYRIWLQGPWSMTPYTHLVYFPPERPPVGKAPMPMAFGPAGRVTVAEDSRIDPNHQLRLLFAGLDPAAGPLRVELSRRRTVSDLRDGLLMPKGTVVASLWDPQRESYVALSRPFTVRPGRVVAAPLDFPARAAAQLVVYLDRPAGTSAMLRNLVMIVRQEDREREPDFRVTTAWGMYGLWYDLKPTAAILEAGNDILFLRPVKVGLAGGAISRFAGTLSKRPSLDSSDVSGAGAP